MYVEGDIKKTVCNNIFTGVGLVYTYVDMKPSNHIITYDRKMFNPFVFLGYSFNIKNHY